MAASTTASTSCCSRPFDRCARVPCVRSPTSWRPRDWPPSPSVRSGARSAQRRRLEDCGATSRWVARSAAPVTPRSNTGSWPRVRTARLAGARPRDVPRRHPRRRHGGAGLPAAALRRRERPPGRQTKPAACAPPTTGPWSASATAPARGGSSTPIGIPDAVAVARPRGRQGRPWKEAGIPGIPARVAQDIRGYYETAALGLSDHVPSAWSGTRWFFDQTETGAILLAARAAMQRRRREAAHLVLHGPRRPLTAKKHGNGRASPQLGRAGRGTHASVRGLQDHDPRRAPDAEPPRCGCVKRPHSGQPLVGWLDRSRAFARRGGGGTSWSGPRLWHWCERTRRGMTATSRCRPPPSSSGSAATTSPRT